MKIKFYNSLMFRITFAFVLLITVITGATYAYTYNEAKKALMSTIQSQLKQLSIIGTSILNDEQKNFLINMTKADEESQILKDINTAHYNLRKNDPNISEFYSMRKNGDEIIFLSDDWAISDPGEHSFVGDVYEDYDPMLLEAFKGEPVVSEDLYTDEWGTWLTGYSPIKNQNGETEVVLAVDMDVSVVQQKINFISSLIYYIIGIGILAAGLMILFFSLTIVKNLNDITKASLKLSEGQLDVVLPDIKAKNEIYLLNEGMKSMMSAITFLTDKINK